MLHSKLAKLIFAILLFSSSAYSQWFQQNSGVNYQLNSVYFIDQNTGFAAGFNGSVLKTTNGGTNWTASIILDTIVTYNSIYFINPNTGYIAGRILILGSNFEAEPKIIKTTNSGVSWFSVLNDSGYTLRSIYFINSNTGFASGGLYSLGENYLLTTTNAGVNWQLATLGEGYLWCISFKDANTGLICCSGGNIYRTTNAGANWGLFQSLTEPFISCITFLDANTGLITGGSTSQILGHIYKTVNGGYNWSLVYTDNWGIINNAKFVNSSTGFAVGTYDPSLLYPISSRILKTTNSGNNWFIDSLFKKINGLISLYFTDPNTGYVVGSKGIILKTTTGGNLMGIVPIGTEIPREFSLAQNYPNPFNPVTTIKFNISKESDVKITVFDILGKEVQTLVNESVKAGEYKVSFDSGRFASGVYFYRLEAGDFIDTKKMVVIK
jgi:photosystem II stability/assembly factor-like uncharacterized protein